jgi:hypothetical protein
MWPLRARLRVDASVTDIAGRINGIVTPIDDHTCLLKLAPDSFDLVVLAMSTLDVDFQVESPAELAQHLRKLSNRFANAVAQN